MKHISTKVWTFCRISKHGQVRDSLKTTTFLSREVKTTRIDIVATSWALSTALLFEMCEICGLLFFCSFNVTFYAWLMKKIYQISKQMTKRLHFTVIFCFLKAAESVHLVEVKCWHALQNNSHNNIQLDDSFFLRNSTKNGKVAFSINLFFWQNQFPNRFSTTAWKKNEHTHRFSLSIKTWK